MLSVADAKDSFIAPHSVSDYGRFIAFTSLDPELADDDDNLWQGAFVRDVIAGTNQFLRTPQTSLLGPERLAFSPVLSADARFVAWFEQATQASILFEVPTQIFWLDRNTGRSAVVRFAGASLGGPGPSLSRDGRWLAFADRLPSSLTLNIFIRDMLTPDATNELISVNRFGTGGGNGDSIAPVWSPDGNWVIFLSQASDLTIDLVSGDNLVFARNLPTGRTRLVSNDKGPNGLPIAAGTAAHDQ